MTTQLICKLLRSREAAAAVDVRTWPPVLDTGKYQGWGTALSSFVIVFVKRSEVYLSLE